jgi:hypothetical protein
MVKRIFLIVSLLYLFTTSQIFAQPIPLWKTGQTTCYNSTGTLIPCVGTEQDGDLQPGVVWPIPRFTDHGNGTVADNLFGLQWLKDANCIQTLYPSFDQDFDFGDGLVTWLNFVKGINNGDFPLCGAGHTDWRLPNRKELRSLLDYGRSNPALPVGHPFINAANIYNFWWSSTNAFLSNGFSIEVWIVSLAFGFSQPHLKVNTAYAWPVRTGQPGVLDHFEFTNIPSPQAIGVPFLTTITAKDYLGNTVTNINGSVALSAVSGSINPTTMVLLSGIGTENIALDTISSGNQVIANGTGHIGKSNTFNVAGPPNVTTDSPTDLTVGLATLNGTVNANNGTTDVTFEYGLGNSYGSTVTADQSPAVENTSTAFSKVITGLSPNTTYHYRTVGVNFMGTTVGNDRTVTTLQATQPPSVTTSAASGVTSTGATLNGVVNPNGSPTTYFFRWGKTTSYGQVTSTTSAGSGTSGQSVPTSISSLSPNTTYHYRLVASNTFGITNGSDQTFIPVTLPAFENFIYLPLIFR